MGEKPTDEQILVALRDARNGREMTYALRNILRREFPNTTTAFLRRRLSRMEMDGLVQRVSSCYERQICWALTGARQIEGGR